MVCSESHYSVIFSPDPSLLSPSPPSLARGGRREKQEEGKGEESKSGRAHSSTSSSSAEQREEELLLEKAVGGGGRGAALEEQSEGEGKVGRCREDEVFDLQYYDGLARQDEVNEVIAPAPPRRSRHTKYRQ